MELLKMTGFMTVLEKEGEEKMPDCDRFDENEKSDLTLLGEGQVSVPVQKTTLEELFKRDLLGHEYEMAVLDTGSMHDQVLAAVSSSGLLLSFVGIMNGQYVDLNNFL